MDEWLVLFEEWSWLVREEKGLRDARRAPDEINRCYQAQERTIARAAARLPNGGDIGTWVEHALVKTALDAPEREFALLVLYHRKLFPRRYLSPYVQSGLQGKYTENVLRSASEAYGREPVLRELIAFAKTGALPYERMRFLLFYVHDARWSKQSPRRGTEYDLKLELIRITSGGTVTWHMKRPNDDE